MQVMTSKASCVSLCYSIVFLYIHSDNEYRCVECRGSKPLLEYEVAFTVQHTELTDRLKCPRKDFRSTFLMWTYLPRYIPMYLLI